ncbi:unnamed protein product, partial [Callosobruchus maculatus]
CFTSFRRSCSLCGYTYPFYVHCIYFFYVGWIPICFNLSKKNKKIISPTNHSREQTSLRPVTSTSKPLLKECLMSATHVPAGLSVRTEWSADARSPERVYGPVYLSVKTVQATGEESHICSSLRPA